MKKETRFKLAAFDMDGTTLNSQHVLSKKTIEMINKFSERGVKIIFATGRMENAVMKHLECINSDGLVVAHNGGLVKNIISGEVLLKKTVVPEVVHEVMNFSNSQSSVLHFNLESGVYASKENEHSTQYGKELGINIETTDLTRYVHEEPISLLLIDKKDKLHSYLQFMIHNYQNSFDYVFIPWKDSTWMLQFLAPNTSKGQAVIDLSHQLGINPRKEVISFGDSYNDIEMIEGTYFGVAMDNACKELKKVANYVTKSNNADGVAYVLEKILMNENRFLCNL